jgi:WD40 repeat protein
MPDPRSLRPGDPERLGAYRLVGLLGEGAQGTVFLGEAPGGHHVAVKVLHARITGDDKVRRRIMREVEAARQVRQFCTARVLDVATTGSTFYIVSEYVPGESLKQLVTREGPRDGGALERLAVGTASALAAIHQTGIVHRDFKPQNVLMGPDGPRVIDFGIARSLDATTSETTGPVGTPAYMSPEQITSGDIDPASDVFSWGGTMVFAATGSPAFGRDSVPVVMYRILNEDPDLSGVPESLRDMVAAALAKEPERRPAATEVLLGLLGDRPGPAVRGAPVRRVDPGQPDAEQADLEQADLEQADAERLDPDRDGPDRGDEGAVPEENVAAVIAGSAGARPEPTQRDGTNVHALPGLTEPPRPAERSPSAERRRQPAVPQAPEPLERSRPLGPPPATRPHGAAGPVPAGRRPRRIKRLMAGVTTLAVIVTAAGVAVAAHRSGPATLTGLAPTVAAVVFSPDGKALMTVDSQTVRWWDVASHHQVGAPLNLTELLSAVALSPDGKVLATGGGDDMVRLWDAATRRQIGAVNHEAGVYAVAFSPDGRTLATGGDDGTVRLWDAATRRQIGVLRGDGGVYGVNALAFSPDGRLLATGGGDDMVRLWDVASRREVGDPLPGHDGDVYGVNAVMFSPDGRLLATGGGDDVVRLWDVASRRTVGGPFTGHDGGVNAVVFSPDGTLLATGGGDHTVRLWDVAARRQVGGLNHEASVYAVAFSPDGRTLATGGTNSAVRLWKIPPDMENR